MKVLLGFLLVFCLAAIGCTDEESALSDDGGADVVDTFMAQDAGTFEDAASEVGSPDAFVGDAEEEASLPDQGEDQ